MKAQHPGLIIYLVMLMLLPIWSYSQADTAQSSKVVVITTNDGGEFIGTIISQDSREVLIQTKDRGLVSIPKYQVKEMKEIKKEEMTLTGDYVPGEVFSSRYFITTNGLPIEKGESYILWNLWGPDFQFGVGKNLGVGIMTSWVGFPIIGSVKYSIELKEKTSLGLGTLLGSGTWIDPKFGIALPFASLTVGDRRANFTFSGGYGAVFMEGESDGRLLLSVAGMRKVGKKVSFVFDSFLMPKSQGKPGFGLIIPGVRLQTESRKAFQFGFGGLVADGEVIPAPIAFVQWFRKL